MKRLGIGKLDLISANCALHDECFKFMSKAQWPNLKELWLSKIGIILANPAVSPRCLKYLEGIKWDLSQLGTFFEDSFSINYFSCVVRTQSK